MRDLTISPPPARLSVDASRNGGIHIRGGNRSEIRVQAGVQVWGRSEAEARALAETIKIRTEGGRIEADAPPGTGRSWSVSYEIRVPRRTDLDLTTVNGGIDIENVWGDLRFRAKNGGVSLSGLGGIVEGRADNGGLTVNLDGDSWDGDGLDVSTTNGGVKLTIPEDYSAELETGTSNGHMRLDFPVTVQGRIDRRIRTTLGAGGAPVRVTTTNGSVVVRRR